MKKANLTGAATVAFGILLATTCAGTASAQVLGQPTTPVQKPLSVKVGAFFPTNSKAQRSGGHTQISAGADYALTKTTATNPAVPSIYFDYQGGSHKGGHVNTYGAGIAIRSFGNAPVSRGGSPYIGAGVGVYNENVKPAGSHSENKTNLGGKVFVGDELGGNFFVEANYQILPSAHGVNPSGIGVQVGLRF